MLPVIACFHDVDSRVQYYACEALYNIVKVARGAVLPFFNDIFDGLSKVSAEFLTENKIREKLFDRIHYELYTPERLAKNDLNISCNGY